MSKKINQLDSKTSPDSSDLIYVAKDDGAGWFSDSKSSVLNLKNTFLNTTTSQKTSDYEILLSECNGTYFSNKGSSSQIKFTLPKSEKEIEVNFVIEENYPIEISPDSEDKIQTLSSTDGESIFGIDYGGTIKLRGIRDGWYISSLYKTWNLTGSP